jgi:hypothetical protein
MSCCGKNGSVSPIYSVIHTVTSCECTGPGFCARHKCDKPEHLYNLCRTHLGYFQQYENGTGPGQSAAERRSDHVVPLLNRVTIGLGDVVAWLIRVATFGKLKMCSACQGRKARLNKIRLWPWGRGAR